MRTPGPDRGGNTRTTHSLGPWPSAASNRRERGGRICTHLPMCVHTCVVATIVATVTVQQPEWLAPLPHMKWLVAAGGLAAFGCVLLWIGRESRTAQPRHAADGTVTIPGDSHRAAYVAGVWAIGGGVLALVDWATPSAAPPYAPFMAWLWVILMFASLAGMGLALRYSAVFSEEGLAVRHPLESFFLPWHAFEGLEDGPSFTLRVFVGSHEGVVVRRPFSRLFGEPRVPNSFVVSPEALVGGASTFRKELDLALETFMGGPDVER